MDRFKILQLLLVLSLVSMSHANLPSQMYWNIVLPDVAMPKAIIDTLHLEGPGYYTNSQQAAAMKTTLELCEELTVRGENKTCATSLESIVNFIVSELRTNRVVTMSTTLYSEGTATRMQAYTIASMRELAGSKTVVCHPLSYAYPVFLCHGAESTKAYEVELRGEDGTAVKSAAVCHTDTSDWDPNNMALRILNIKAGSTHPVCHFFQEGHVLWTRSAN